MTYDPARPRYTLTLAGAEYELFGTLELVEAIEYALQDGILQISTRVVGMGLTDTAKLLAAALTANGHRLTAREAGQILLNEIGVNSDAYKLLQLNLFAFLRTVLEPPELREKTAKRMGEMIGEWTAPPASRGKRTRKSA
jgi:hypothetical protein